MADERGDSLDVSIVVVSYRVRDYTLACVESVGRHAGRSTVETILVDNASDDGTVEAVRERFPWVKVIANERNLGFPAANNQAMRIAGGRYMLLLNCDAELREGAVDRMVEYMDAHGEVGVLGPRLVYADGGHQLSVNPFPTAWIVATQMLQLARLFPESRWFAPHRQMLMPRDAPRVADVDWVSGACLLVRRRALEHVGLMDEAFFLYYEETDLCRRARDDGWRVVYFPEATVLHHGRKATGKASAFCLGHARKSLMHYASKHMSGPQRECVRGLLIAACLVQGALSRVSWWLRRNPEDRERARVCRSCVRAALSRDPTPRVPTLPHSPEAALPTVSVVVPTYRRGWDEIKDTLQALAAQEPSPMEVLIVDQTPSPDTRIGEYAERTAGFRYLHIETPGLPNARNVGARETRGDVIAYCDDDAVPVSGWIEALSWRYEDPHVAGVVGRVLIPGRAPTRRARSRVGRFSPFDADFADNYDADFPSRVDSLTGCNMSVRRSALKAAGGFRTEYGGTAHLEESDLSLRLLRRGGRIVFEPAAQVEHRVHATGGCRPPDRSTWVYWYARNYALLFCSHFRGWGFWPFVLARLARVVLFCWQGRSLKPLGSGVCGLFDGVLSYRFVSASQRDLPRWSGR